MVPAQYLQACLHLDTCTTELCLMLLLIGCNQRRRFMFHKIALPVIIGITFPESGVGSQNALDDCCNPCCAKISSPATQFLGPSQSLFLASERWAAVMGCTVPSRISKHLSSSKQMKLSALTTDAKTLATPAGKLRKGAKRLLTVNSSE